MTDLTIHCGHKELEITQIKITVYCKECGQRYNIITFRKG